MSFDKVRLNTWQLFEIQKYVSDSNFEKIVDEAMNPFHKVLNRAKGIINMTIDNEIGDIITDRIIKQSCNETAMTVVDTIDVELKSIDEYFDRYVEVVKKIKEYTSIELLKFNFKGFKLERVLELCKRIKLLLTYYTDIEYEFALMIISDNEYEPGYFDFGDNTKIIVENDLCK